MRIRIKNGPPHKRTKTMNKEEVKKQIESLDKEVEKLKSIINAPDKAENHFIELWNGTTNIIDGLYPNSIFLKKDGVILFEQDLKDGWLICNFELVWSIFEKEYNMNYKEIQSFIKNILETRLNCKGLTPQNGNHAIALCWKHV